MVAQLKSCRIETLDLVPEQSFDPYIKAKIDDGDPEFLELFLYEKSRRIDEMTSRDLYIKRSYELFYPLREFLAWSGSKLKKLNLE